MQFFIARHASVLNPKGIHYRRESGFPLADLGQQEARLMGLLLKDEHLTQIYASPMERTQTTAEIIREGINLDKEIITKEYLNEWDEGEYYLDIAKRVSQILQDRHEGALFVLHQGVIQVFLNLISGFKLNQYDHWLCRPASIYKINIVNGKTNIEQIYKT